MTPEQLDAISNAQCLRAADKMGLVKHIDAASSDRLALLGAIESLQDALKAAEAALADIGDADRMPGDGLVWCEQRAAKALPIVRAALLGGEA